MKFSRQKKSINKPKKKDSHLIGMRNGRMENEMVKRGRRWAYIRWEKQLTKSEINDCEKQMKTDKLKTIEA